MQGLWPAFDVSSLFLSLHWNWIEINVQWRGNDSIWILYNPVGISSEFPPWYSWAPGWGRVTVSSEVSEQFSEHGSPGAKTILLFKFFQKQPVTCLQLLSSSPNIVHSPVEPSLYNRYKHKEEFPKENLFCYCQLQTDFHCWIVSRLFWNLPFWNYSPIILSPVNRRLNIHPNQ